MYVQTIVNTDSASVWAGSGVAVWFMPVADNTWVRVAADSPGYSNWNDNSWGYTAHNHAILGVLVESWDFNGGSYRVDVDRRIQLWSDGTGWWEEHSDSPVTWWPNDTYFQAYIRWYKIWTWIEAWCDAEGRGVFGSSAKAEMDFRNYFFIFEQWT
jgi:hypothetical protein